MPVQPATTLPCEWVESETPDGGVELRIRQRGRGLLIGVPIFFALLIGVRALRFWPLPTDQLGWSVGISAALIFFAIWCSFARQYWRMGTGYIETHLDFGPWQRVRRYQNGELEIVTGRTNHDTPFYRLFAVVNGKRHFLFERSMNDIVQLARYISARTGFKTF
jgi:hypothetical protein